MQAAGAAAASAGGSEETAPAAEQLFAIIYRPGPLWRQGRPFREQVAIREHFAYVRGLFNEGRIFAAGSVGG